MVAFPWQHNQTKRFANILTRHQKSLPVYSVLSVVLSFQTLSMSNLWFTDLHEWKKMIMGLAIYRSNLTNYFNLLWFIIYLLITYFKKYPTLALLAIKSEKCSSYRRNSRKHIFFKKKFHLILLIPGCSYLLNDRNLVFSLFHSG